jgi:HPr kinase/phosphorylase
VAANHHASLVVVRDRGVLFRGPSGSGKTSLALALMAQARRDGWFGRLVGDDQVYIEARGNRLLGWVPPPIAGLAELPPLGPVRLPYEARVVVDLVVDLVPEAALPRMIDRATIRLEEVELPVVQLPQRSTAAALPVLLHILFNRDVAGNLPE